MGAGIGSSRSSSRTKRAKAARLSRSTATAGCCFLPRAPSIVGPSRSTSALAVTSRSQASAAASRIFKWCGASSYAATVWRHQSAASRERCGGGAGSSTGNTGSTSRTGGGASSSRWDLRGMVHLYAPPTRISELPATGKGRNQSPSVQPAIRKNRPENGFHGRRKPFPAPNFNGFRPVKSSTCEEGSGAQCDRRTVDRGQHVAKIEHSRARPMGTFFFFEPPPAHNRTIKRPAVRQEPTLIRRGAPGVLPLKHLAGDHPNRQLVCFQRGCHGCAPGDR